MERVNRVFLTSTYRHLSGPSAVVLADSVFGAPGEEVAGLTAVNQSVAEPGQIHPHHVHVERTLRLLTGMRWRGGERRSMHPGV